MRLAGVSTSVYSDTPIPELAYLANQLYNPISTVERRVETVQLPTREKYSVSSIIQLAPPRMDDLERLKPRGGSHGPPRGIWAVPNTSIIPVSVGLYMKIRVPGLVVKCDGKSLPTMPRNARGELLASALLNWVVDRDKHIIDQLEALKSGDPDAFNEVKEEFHDLLSISPDIIDLRDRIATIAVSDVQSAITQYAIFLMELKSAPRWRDLTEKWVIAPSSTPRKAVEGEPLAPGERTVDLPEQVRGLVFNTHVIVEAPMVAAERRIFDVERSERLSWVRDIGQQRSTNISQTELEYKLDNLGVKAFKTIPQDVRDYVQGQLDELARTAKLDHLNEAEDERAQEQGWKWGRVRLRVKPLCRALNLIPALIRVKCLNADHSHSFYELFEAPAGVEVVRSYWSRIDGATPASDVATVTPTPSTQGFTSRSPVSKVSSCVTARNETRRKSGSHEAAVTSGSNEAPSYYEVAHQQSRSVLAHHSDVHSNEHFPLCAYAEIQVRKDTWLRVATIQVALLLGLTLVVKVGGISAETNNVSYIFGLPAGILGLASFTIDSIEWQIARWVRRILLGVGAISLGYSLGFPIDLSRFPTFPALPLFGRLSWLEVYNSISMSVTAVVLINLTYLAFGPRHGKNEPARPDWDDTEAEKFANVVASRVIGILFVSIVLGFAALLASLLL